MEYRRFAASLLLIPVLCGCPTLEKAAGSGGPIEYYRGIPITDIHNHDASGFKFLSSFGIWNKYGIRKVVLFGDISEPSAVATDRIALEAARDYPERIIPFMAGIDINDPNIANYIQNQFDKGAMGVGEIVVSSLYSPATSKLPWKADGVADPRLRAIYGICGENRRPALMHIDPLDLSQVRRLIDVSGEFPRTDFIVGHANAYSDIPQLRLLLERTENVYLDFFPGFTVFNPDSAYRLSDYIPLIEQYPSRFFLSSDSGYGVGRDRAYEAIHATLQSVGAATARMIAYENFDKLLGKAKE